MDEPLPPRELARATIVLVHDEGEVVLGRVQDLPVDLDLVDALARLQLHARRTGGRIRLDDPCAGLRRVLHLVGLEAVLAPAASVLEDGREPEGGEQLGGEEVVDPDDPVA